MASRRTTGAEQASFTEELHFRAEILSAPDFFDSTDDVFRRSKIALEWEKSQRAAASETDPLQQRGGEGETRSRSYLEGEKCAAERTLAEVERLANKRIAEGFKETNFTLGVINLVFIVYTFGVYPQHFWLIYLVEGAALISAKFYSFATAKPLNNVLYFLDFCWVMNLIGVLFLLVFCIDGFVGKPLPQSFHRHLFAAALGVACGPLLGACLVLPFVCLLFHDVGTMADLFIHIFPPLLMYTLRWSADSIRASWPSVFYLKYMDNVRFFSTLEEDGTIWPLALGSVAGNSIVLYLVWFFCYSAWMLLIGLDLPRSDRKGSVADGLPPIVPKYDTVFHSLMRGGLCAIIGTKLWSRPRAVSEEMVEQNHFERRDFAAYMAAHLIIVMAGLFVLGWVCFINQTTHGLLLVLITVVSTHKGSQRYTYYVTIMYGKMLRKQFSGVLMKGGGEVV